MVNLIEELDRPGEWYLDRATGDVYIWPPADSSGAVVEFPVLDKPFVSMQDIGHVTLRGLTFELGRGDGIGIADGNRVLLAGCTIRRLGGNAVAIEGGTDCGVLGCDIHTVGARGVILQGGELKSLTPGRHFVANCHIHDFTRVDRVYAPAVHLFGVGNRVAHNLLCDSPHHAIRLEGHEHLIELNEIHSVVYGNVFYCAAGGRWPAGSTLPSRRSSLDTPTRPTCRRTPTATSSAATWLSIAPG